MATGPALIVAIDSQNVFVLRSGILRSHVLPIVAICALSDALLSALVFGGQRLAWAKPPVCARWPELA